MSNDPTPAVPAPSESDLKRDLEDWYAYTVERCGVESVPATALRRMVAAEAELARLRAPVAPAKCPACGDQGFWYSPDTGEYVSCGCKNKAIVAPAEALSGERASAKMLEALRELVRNDALPKCNPQYPPFNELDECPAGHEYECGGCRMRRQVLSAIAEGEDDLVREVASEALSEERLAGITARGQGLTTRIARWIHERADEFTRMKFVDPVMKRASEKGWPETLLHNIANEVASTFRTDDIADLLREVARLKDAALQPSAPRACRAQCNALTPGDPSMCDASGEACVCLQEDLLRASLAAKDAELAGAKEQVCSLLDLGSGQKAALAAAQQREQAMREALIKAHECLTGGCGLDESEHPESPYHFIFAALALAGPAAAE